MTLSERAALRAKHPAGWEPHVVESGDIANAVSQPMPGTPSHDDLIRGWDMDPADWQIVGDVQVRRWQRYDGEWLRYFRADLTRRRHRGDPVDVEKLCRAAVKKPKALRVKPAGPFALVVTLNDWQIGKGEGGGTAATVAAIERQLDQLAGMVEDLRPAEVILANAGDLTERVSGHYASQAFTVDLDEREQQRVARRLLLRAVESVLAAPKVRLLGVPCNHGENRNGAGKSQTRPSDNVSLTLVENVAEVCAANPSRYRHVSAELAPSYVLVTPVQDITLGLTHGHQFRGNGAALGQVATWWHGQIVGMQPAAAADVLLTAHRHHFGITEESGRTLMIAPADDGGSEWYTSATGKSSPRGMLTFTLGRSIGDPLQGERCWDHVRVLR